MCGLMIRASQAKVGIHEFSCDITVYCKCSVLHVYMNIQSDFFSQIITLEHIFRCCLSVNESLTHKKIYVV